MRVGERQQRSKPIVGTALLARAPLEPGQRVYRELRFAGRQLRPSELEHQRDLHARALVRGQVRRVRHGAVQERRGFARRVPLDGVAGCHAQIPRGAQVVAGAVEMTRQVRGGLMLASGEHPLHRLPRARVGVHAGLRRRVLEHDFLIQARA